MDSDDRIEIARRDRERREKEARRSHPAFEESWPPKAVQGRAGDGNPSDPPPSHRAIQLPKLTLGHLKDLAWLGAAIIAGMNWFQNRASVKDVTDAETRAVNTCASAISSALAPIPPRIKLLEDHAKKENQRWNKLDEVNALAKRPNNTPAPQKFGPAAEKRGEVKYEEDEFK